MLQAVKLMLGLEHDSQDLILGLMIEDAKAAVRDYCNCNTCPAPLEYVVRELVVDAFNTNAEGNVSSIKRGDTQINYATVITKAAFTDRQKVAMNRYRRIKF